MKDNNRSCAPRPANNFNAERKINELKLKKLHAYKTRCRRRLYLNKIKRRKHIRAHLHAMYRLHAATQQQVSGAAGRANMYSLFYIKPARLVPYGSIFKMDIE